MPKYRFHLLPEDGLDDLELRFADDFSAMQTAQVVLREQFHRRQPTRRPDLTKVIEVVRSDGITVGFAKVSDAAVREASAVRSRTADVVR